MSQYSIENNFVLICKIVPTSALFVPVEVKFYKHNRTKCFQKITEDLSFIATLVLMCVTLICNRRIAASVKGRIYKPLVKAGMTYGLETVALTH